MDTKKLRQKILDLAIHGKLVPQDPNDEPASVLLERIKVEKEQLIKEGKIKRSRKSAKTSDTPHYGNMPFEVPNSWDIVSVSDLFLLNPKSELNDNMKVGFIPMALVEDGFSGNHFFEERIWKDVNRGYCHFQNGDIGVAKISPCFENRKSTIFKNLPNNYGAGTTELVILRPIKVYAKFYLYLFKSDWYLKEGTKYFKGVVGQQRVHKEIFTDLHIPLPPFAEQCRIVAEIERWFALIDQIEQDKSDLHTIIKQAKSKILDLAIHGKLVPQDPNDKPVIELLKRINPDFTPCDNGHSEKLPQGWYSVTINDVCSIIGGVSYNKVDIQDTGIRVLRGGNIQRGKVFYCSDDVFIPFSYQNKENQVQYGDIIVVASTGSQTLIGKTGFVDRDIPKTQIGAFLRIVRPKQKTLSPYIRLLFQTDAYKDYIRNVAKGSNINNVKNAHLQNYQICLPPLVEQQRIVAKIDELFSVLDNIQNALEA